MNFFQCLVCGQQHPQITPEAWKCQNCQTHYRIESGIPLLIRNWESHQQEIELAQQHAANWYVTAQPAEDLSPWRHHVRKRREYVQGSIAQHIASLSLSRLPNVLDMGCGDGNHLAYLQAYAENLHGSDYNLLRLVRAKQLQPTATVFLADILDYPSQDNFFDLVFFNHVIEHIPDDIRALETIYRVLKPNGLLILGTPNEGAAWWQLAYRLQPKMLELSDHVHFYTLESLSKKIEAAGFSIQETKFLGWGPPHWSLDGLIRRYKWVDDGLSWIGQRIIPNQASSLYVVATK